MKVDKTSDGMPKELSLHPLYYMYFLRLNVNKQST